MNAAKVGLLAALVIANIAFVAGWILAAKRHGLRERPTLADIAIGFVTDFLDTLGIGSYAPTTALFKFRGKPADEILQCSDPKIPLPSWERSSTARCSCHSSSSRSDRS